MSFPIQSTDDIIAALRQRPEWKEEVRRELLTEELLDLPAVVRSLATAQARTEELVTELASSINGLVARMDQLVAAQKDTEEKLACLIEEVNKLAVAQERTERKLEELAAAQERTERRLEELATAQQETEQELVAFSNSMKEKLNHIEIVLRRHEGWIIEDRAVAKLHNYLRRWLKSISVLSNREKNSMIDGAMEENAITEEESFEVGEADALAVGIDNRTGQLTCVAVEVSATVDEGDLERADKRSKIFLKVARAAMARDPERWCRVLPSEPLKAFGLVIGREIADDIKEKAENRGIMFNAFRNG